MKIIEVDSKVLIDDFEFYGQIEQEKYCSKCKFNLVYYDDLIRIFVLNVIVGLNLNVVTLIANIAPIDQKNLYHRSSVIQLKEALIQQGLIPFLSKLLY